MSVITMCSTKGGIGKSTFIVCSIGISLLIKKGVLLTAC